MTFNAIQEHNEDVLEAAAEVQASADAWMEHLNELWDEQMEADDADMVGFDEGDY